MIIRENREYDELKKVLDTLQLSEKNRGLAERYLDMSGPEDEELLKEVENQDFSQLSSNKDYEVYRYLENIKRKNNDAFAGRFVRLVARIGGATAKRPLCYYGFGRAFEYLETFLTPVQGAALRAEELAWNSNHFHRPEYEFLIEMGIKDPHVLLEMMELCYHKDSANTKMFLSGVYLHCVKPLADAKSVLFVPAKEGDIRTEDDPDNVRRITDYLEKRLINNSAGLFTKKDEPQGEEDDRLKAYLTDADPEEPFPQEMRALISGRRRHDYRMNFLPFLAFLAIEHSNRFVSVIRFASVVDGDTVPNLPLDACRRTGDEWFYSHLDKLEKILPVPDKIYLLWAVHRREKEILARLIKEKPDTVEGTLHQTSSDDRGYLLMQVRENAPALYEKAGIQIADNYRRAVAEELTQKFETEQGDAVRYLLGDAPIETILPYVPKWRELYLDSRRYDKIRFCQECGEEQLYRRALVLECLRLHDSYFRRYWLDPKYKNNTQGYTKLIEPRQIRSILGLMEEENVPPQYQIEFLGHVYDGYYDQEGRKGDTAAARCAEALFEQRPKWHQEFAEASRGRMVQARVLAIRVMGEKAEEYKEELFACIGESAKQAKDFLRGIYSQHREWEDDILKMLQGKKAAAREMAVQVLQSWGAENYEEALTRAYDAEKTKKVKQLIGDVLAAGEKGGQDPQEKTQDGLISDILLGGRKRKIAWLVPESLPKVHKKDGEEASEDHLAALFVAYADMNFPGVNEDARKLSEDLVPDELSACMQEVYARWLADGAQAKKKWVVYAAAIHGGEGIVPALYAQIQEWPKISRGAMAAEAVRAMALNGSTAALLRVDQISRKFKYYQVKDAASKALDYAAEQLQIPREELEDRIVPDLGFNERMEQVFDYGRRRFQVILTPALALEVYDEKGKKLKNLPSPGKTDDPEKSKAAYDAWKQLKKQLKTVIANQKIRLEEALNNRRRWQAGKWRELFVKNPVMHQFAAGLIWGNYTDGVLTDTFRYMEDGTFNTPDEDEYELPDEGVIGLVHPIELSQELIGAWQEQLEDYEVVQPVEQLYRPVYRVTEEEKEQTELLRFAGMVLNGLSLTGKLTGMGWFKGEIGDGGGYYTLYRYDPDQGMGVELEFSGCCIGDENQDLVVYEAYFYKPGVTEKVGSTLPRACLTGR